MREIARRTNIKQNSSQGRPTRPCDFLSGDMAMCDVVMFEIDKAVGRLHDSRGKNKVISSFNRLIAQSAEGAHLAIAKSPNRQITKSPHRHMDR